MSDDMEKNRAERRWQYQGKGEFVIFNMMVWEGITGKLVLRQRPEDVGVGGAKWMAMKKALKEEMAS